jgi:PAS domain S-box-containing protein
MTAQSSGRIDPSEYPPPSVPIASTFSGGVAPEDGTPEVSPQLQADLLDAAAWSEMLATYGRTIKAAVALTDAQGCILGECHNAQPVWKLFHANAPGGDAGCPFCITTSITCPGVAEALQTGEAVMMRDQAGLSHVAVPLSLGTQRLGAIVAGQVFDRYPDSLTLLRVAKDFGIPAQQLWDVAKKQAPVSRAILQASGDLLRVLGQAFLRQRYAKVLEARLTETNARFRLLVEGVRGYALFTVDLSGDVTSWNRGAERLLGFVEDEIVGRNFSCVFDAEDIRNHVPESHLQKALHAGRAEADGWRVRGDRQQFWAKVNITALTPETGPIAGFAILIQDVTEQRKIANLLEEARLERTRTQERFVSHVSHELRTPLTAIYFFTTNVLDGLLGKLTPAQHEHLTLALDNVNQLKEMVKDLLDITRVDTHKLVIEPQHASLKKLVAHVLHTCITSAAAKNISLRSQVALGLPFVWADPVRVRQILTNLIDNGIKFTPAGGTVAVDVQILPEDGNYLRLAVSDTGCGISPENCALVFDRLAQVRSDNEASRTGLGLGLFISRELVSMHGGRIWVESRLGQGSTFYFTLPVFSLAKFCAHVLTTPNLELGFVTLITLDVAAIEGDMQSDMSSEIRRVLEDCIRLDKDLLLPPMSDAEPVTTFFIIACTDARGFAVIARRIRRGLQDFDKASRLTPALASTTLTVEPGESREKQIGELTAGLDRLIQAHLGNERETP